MNDWQATWKFATDPGQSGCTNCSGFQEVSSVDVSSDGLSGTLHFKELYPGWLNLLSTAFLQGKWLSTIKVADAAKSMPVSSAIASVPFERPVHDHQRLEDRDRLRAEPELEGRR